MGSTTNDDIFAIDSNIAHVANFEIFEIFARITNTGVDLVSISASFDASSQSCPAAGISKLKIDFQ